MDVHSTRSLRLHGTRLSVIVLASSIVAVLAALASPGLAPIARAQDGDGEGMTVTIHPYSCSEDGEPTEVPVFTEDACEGVEHAFALTGPNGVTEELPASTEDPSGDIEVGPYAEEPDGPGGTGEWSITDLDHTSGTWVIPSCWTGDAASGVRPATVLYDDQATWRVIWDRPDSSLRCDWFEFTAEGSGVSPHPIHLETIPTAQPELVVAGRGDEAMMESTVTGAADISVPMRLIERSRGDEISFEADADGTVIVWPGEYELINDLTGDSEVFTTSGNDTTVALIGVPPDTGSTAAGEESTTIDITVSRCEDVVNGTGVDCTGIDYDEPQPLLEILVDGEQYPGGPLRLEDTGVGMRARIDVPADAELTVRVVDNIPDGYAPADGFDPLVIDAGDVPEGGCGGEQACPVLDMVLVPAS